jgi:hypothetical protein
MRDLRALARAVAALAVAGLGCLDDSPTGPMSADGGARLRIQAQIAGGQAVDRTLRIRIFYRRQAAGDAAQEIELSSSPAEIVVPSGTTHSQEVAVNLAPCFADAERVGSEAGCRFGIELALIDTDGQMLSTEEQEVTALTPDATVEPPPIVLPAAEIGLARTEAAFTAEELAALPGAQPVQITSVTGAPLGTLSTTVTSGANWLKHTIDQDAKILTLQPSTTDAVAPVTYAATLTVASSRSGVGPKDIAVTYTVTPRARTLLVAPHGTGSGRVTSTPSGIDCALAESGAAGTCSADFAHGTQVTLTAAPDGGTGFNGFTGECSGTSCEITMDQPRDRPRSVGAAFRWLPAARVDVRSDGAAPPDPDVVVVNNFADALDRVAPGGTIRVFAGTYDVANLTIDKPVVIEANVGDTPLLRTGEQYGFVITNAAPGTVTIRGLHFEMAGLHAVVAMNQYDQVVVEDSRFSATAGGPSPFGLPYGFVSLRASNGPPGSNFIVRRNIVVGGHWAIMASRARAQFVGNTTRGQATGGIEFDGSSGLIEGNTVSECGQEYCILVLEAPGGVAVVGNTVRNEHPRRVQTGIGVFGGGTVRIEDNQVIGTGGSGRSPGDHAFAWGIHMTGAAAEQQHATVLRNRVSGANDGLKFVNVYRGRIEGNIVDPCGAGSCIGVWGTDVSGAAIEVRSNTLRSVLGRRTFFAIQSMWVSNAGTLAITDNDIAGATAPGDPASPASYSLDIAFQNGAWWPPGTEGVERGAPVEFSRNRITNAAVGVRAFHGGVVEGRDNVFTTVYGEVLGTHDRGVNRLQFNDVNGYQFSLALSGSPVADVPHRGTLDVRCNYWGGGAPVAVSPTVPASAYTPYATTPVAGTGATTCSGGQ